MKLQIKKLNFINYKNMKLKFTLLLFVFILISGIMEGQEYNIEFGPKKRKPFHKEIIKHLHSDSSGHYVLFKGKKSKLVIEKFGNDFRPLFSKKFPIKKTKIIRQYISFAKNKFIWIYTVKNKKKKEIDFMLNIIDMEGNIVQTKKIKSISSKKDEPWFHLRWTLSSDKSKLLITGRTSKMKNSNFDFRAWTIVVDEKHDVIWEKEIGLDLPSRLVNHKYWKITNNAKAILATEIYKNKNREDLLRFFSLTEEDENLKLMKLNSSGVKIASHKIIEKENGDLLGVAFYYDELEEMKITGLMKIDIDGKDFSSKTNYCSFPNQSFVYGKNKPSNQKLEEGIDFTFFFKIKDVFINDKKEISIVSEEELHKVKLEYDKKSDGPVRRNYYYSNLIGVVRINNIPEVLDVTIFPKKQTFRDVNYYTSNSQLKTKNRTYFIYNDHKKNLKDNLESPKSYKKLKRQLNMITLLAYINDDGELIREQLYSKKDYNTSIMPRYSKQISPNKIFIIGFNISPLKYEFIRLGTVTIN